MLKANQLFSDDRNDSILMILISNDQPHVPARPSTFDNEDLWSSLEEQPSIGDRFFGSRVLSDCALSYLDQMDFIVHKKPPAMIRNQLTKASKPSSTPSIVGTIHIG